MFGDLKVERLKVRKSLISSFTEQVSHKFDLLIECRYQCLIGILLFGGHHIFNHGDMHYLRISTISFLSRCSLLLVSPIFSSIYFYATCTEYANVHVYYFRVPSFSSITCRMSETPERFVFYQRRA